MALEKADLTTINKYVRDAVDRLPPRDIKALSVGHLTVGSITSSDDLVFQVGSAERGRLTKAGTLMLGAGDNMPTTDTVLGKYLNLSHGFNATPDKGLLPTVKISRIISHSNALPQDFTGDGAENFSTLVSIAEGDSNNLVQPVALFGSALNAGNGAVVGGSSPDATGVYGVGRVYGSGNGVAIGGFFYGQRDSSSGGAITGIQTTALNNTGDVSYSPSATTDTTIWITNLGAHKIGSGILIGPPGSTPGIDVGIGVQGGVVSASFRDDSTAPTSLLVNGTHTYGLDLNGGTFSGTAIRLPNGKGIYARDGSNSFDLNVLYMDVSDNINLAPSGNAVLLGGALTIADAKNIVLGTTTGTKIGTATNQKLAFFNATPAIQQTGGALTASGTWGPTEQSMLQKVYNMARTFGLLS